MKWIRQREFSTRLTKSQWTILTVGVVLLILGMPLLLHQSDPAPIFGRYSIRFFPILALWLVVAAALVIVGAKLNPALSSGLIVTIVSVGLTVLGLEIVIRLTSNQLMGITYSSGLGKAYSLYAPPNYFDELLGWRIVPGSRFVQDHEGFSKGHFNSMGWRDVDHAFEKPPGVFRILVLGDSFVEAMHVDLEDAFYRVLDRRLNQVSNRKVEVITLGRSNSGQGTQYVNLEREGLRYSPDLVLSIFLSANDVRDNSIDIFGHLGKKVRPFFTLDGTGELIFRDDYLKQGWSRFQAKQIGTWPEYKSKITAITQRSIVLTFIHERIVGIADRVDELIQDNDKAKDHGGSENILATSSAYNVFMPSFDEAAPETRRIWSDAFDVTNALYLEMSEVSRQHGAEFLVVMIGMGPGAERQAMERYPFLDLDSPTRLFGHFFAENSIRYLDLVESFRNSYAATGIHYYGFESGDKLFGRGHWNERGHEFAAEEILRFLQESDWIDTGAGESTDSLTMVDGKTRALESVK